MSVVANLSSSAATAAQSLGRVIDADMAREASQLTKFKILNEASTAMLSSANTNKLSLLSLVGAD